MDEVKKELSYILKEGLENGYIQKSEYEAMDPKDKSLSKFYVKFLVNSIKVIRLQIR